MDWARLLGAQGAGRAQSGAGARLVRRQGHWRAQAWALGRWAGVRGALGRGAR